MAVTSSEPLVMNDRLGPERLIKQQKKLLISIKHGKMYPVKTGY